MALMTHGSASTASRRLRLTRHRSGAVESPAETLHAEPDAEGVTRIDLAAFEQAVRGTPARGFPARGFPALATPPRGIALPAVEEEGWAGTLLPHEVEPFPVDALQGPQAGELWTLDVDAVLPRLQPDPVPAPSPEPMPEIEPLALAQVRQEIPLIPLEAPAKVEAPEPAAKVEPPKPAAKVEPPKPAAEIEPPKPAAKIEPPKPATKAMAPKPATPTRGPSAKPSGRRPALSRVTAGLGLAAGAAVAIGAAALIANVTPAAEGATRPVPTITIPGP
jgi:hypothetical protein